MPGHIYLEETLEILETFGHTLEAMKAYSTGKNPKFPGPGNTMKCS